ncbi:MAG: hypothetical protein ACFE8L_06810 [Candidatus Hodarchaeota archaeon]
MVVIIPKKAYLTIVAASVRFANQKIPKDDWLEVSGVFIGKNEGDDVIISAAYPIMHQKLDKNAVIDQYKWSDEDYEALYIIDDKAFSREEFTVGWWHSHPDFKVMMSHIDIKTTLSYQTNNPLAISLVFNPIRLIRQIEVAEKKGDPEKRLKNDPGFKIFRLNDINKGIEASYHTVDFIIEGYDSMEQLVKLTQKFIINITNFFPKDRIFETYENFIMERINQLNSLMQGTEEYLATLIRRGEHNRVPEVLDTQKSEIRKYVAETFMKIENIKEFLDYLEYKEKDIVFPKVEDILSKWDEVISKLDQRMDELSKF